MRGEEWSVYACGGEKREREREKEREVNGTHTHTEEGNKIFKEVNGQKTFQSYYIRIWYY